MPDTINDREIKEIIEEIDIPPGNMSLLSDKNGDTYSEDKLETQRITAKQRFITVKRIFIICLVMLLVLCAMDIFSTWLLKENTPDSINSAIEVIKALLLSMSGYLVAKNTDK